MAEVIKTHSFAAAPGGASRRPVEAARALVPALAERASHMDENDAFVAENYALLKEAGLIEAGVPQEFGGGGADVAELAEMLRLLAHGCGSTALAFSSLCLHRHDRAVKNLHITRRTDVHSFCSVVQ